MMKCNTWSEYNCPQGFFNGIAKHTISKYIVGVIERAITM